MAINNTYYVLLKFNGEPNNRKINRLDIGLPGSPAHVTWYLPDNTLGEVGMKRWDGDYTLPNAPEFQVPHNVLVADTAYGLRNATGDNAGWLYRGGTYRTYLLGAVSYSQFPPAPYACYLGPEGITYEGGYPPLNVELGGFFFPAEPISLALLAVGGLTLRRH